MHYRVRRLEQLGVIRNYIAVLDNSKLGCVVGGLYVKLQHDTPEIRKEIVEYYKNRKDIWWLFDMGQPYDIAFGWFGQSIIQIKNKELELTWKYKRYFKDLKLRVYTRFHHLKRNYVDVANELGLSAAQVHYKIKSLKKRKILLGARAAINFDRIGRSLFKLDIYLEDYSVYDELFAFLCELPEVVYIYEALGSADLEVDLEVEDYVAVKKIEDKIKSKFARAISYTEHANFPKEHKLSYFPQI